MYRIAHRGYSMVAPENTLVAFRQAIACGVDAIEFDVRLTADGVPVLLHDETVNRTTNGSGAVRALMLDEIQALDAGAKTAPRFAGERIPTLREALAMLRGTVTLCIELKAASTPEPTIALLREMGMLEHAIFFSFDTGLLQETAALAPSAARLLLGAWEPLGDKTAFKAWVGTAKRLGASYLGIDESVLQARHVEEIQMSGLGVIAWTVNTAERMRMLAAWGVNGIISDDAGLLMRTMRG